jgi:hypothetical protein
MNTVDLVGRVASETGAELRGGGQAGDVWELSAPGVGFLGRRATSGRISSRSTQVRRSPARRYVWRPCRRTSR